MGVHGCAKNRPQFVRKATAEIDETSRAVRFVKGAKDFQPFSELGFMSVQTIQGDVILETSSPSSKSIDTVTGSEIPELAEKSEVQQSVQR